MVRVQYCKEVAFQSFLKIIRGKFGKAFGISPLSKQLVRRTLHKNGLKSYRGQRKP